MAPDLHISDILEVPCDRLSIHQTSPGKQLHIVIDVPPQRGSGGQLPSEVKCIAYCWDSLNQTKAVSGPAESIKEKGMRHPDQG